ncbi:hypothetical protein ACH5RR_011255 [Cinchona calisaya]|uniref:Transcription initiation factor TFIID subunit 8 n=1 Tax=Cinchona calisaya TaxID=153742 RepID=A0ABD3A4G0_9GENT
MSDGGGENVKETENNFTTTTKKKKKKIARIDDFTLSVAKVAVAQICEAAGFQGFHITALDTLSDLAVRYIRDIGRTSHMYSNLASRTECNVFDVILGLEDLGSLQGFSGASDVHRCLSSSGTVRDIVRYMGEAEETPFAYSIPGFPVVKEREPFRSFKQSGVRPPSEHIPSWLPGFPDPKTYVDLTLGDEKAAESREDEVGQVEKHRDTEKALADLQRKMTCNGSGSSVAPDFGDAANKGKGAMECNPFLAPPLQHGEKEVSLVLPPAKLLDEVLMQGSKHATLDSRISAIEASIDAVKSGPCDSEDGRKNVPLNGRPNVQFKFGGGRKSLHMAISSQNQEIQKFASWFSNDDWKDDKKRREEQILGQSYESAGTDAIVN